MSQLWLVVPAAGQGRRMGAGKPKQYLTLSDDQPVLAHTLARLHSARSSRSLGALFGCWRQLVLATLGAFCGLAARNVGAASEWIAC